MSTPHRIGTALLLVLIVVTGCGQGGPRAIPTSPGVARPSQIEASATRADMPPAADRPLSATSPEKVDRTVLTYDQLIDGFDTFSPVDDGALAVPGGASPPAHVFEGRLELLGEAAAGDIQVLKGSPNVDPAVSHLPEFDFEFVQSDSHLIPVQRGLIITDHPVWNYILGPGRVWQESGDDGYSRASFPFALVWKGSNATFNGVMTFLFDDASVSRVWYQVTQEICWSFKADLWGLVEAAYHPGSVSGADWIRAEYDQELAGRFPTRPIEQLADDYPGVDTSRFGGGITPEHTTTYGLVVNGVNYVAGCRTRYGQYPYCESMRMPSYSTAKSAFAAVALMRLAQKYDPRVPSSLIKDYVPEHTTSPGDWSNVTFDHTLDMATGNFSSAGFMVDEESFQTDAFWSAEFYGEKIAAAFDRPHRAPPGTQWVYHTSDTFIVVRAMHNYLQTQEGSDADLFQFVVDEVFEPVKIGPGAHTSLRTRDGNWKGQAYGGYGLWWTQDDVAKIATLLNDDAGAADGVQILHPDLLTAAMQLDPDDRGVEIDARRKYNDGFWAEKYTPDEGYGCTFWVPHMLGYSGIAIILMPNGSTYYYFNDNREFTWHDAVRESDKIAPHCLQDVAGVPTSSYTSTPSPTGGPTAELRPDGLTHDEAATLSSLKQVDAYPLYTLHYHGDYAQEVSFPQGARQPALDPTWACSLFAALGDMDNRLYGRNFDWMFSPALLLFTDPPDGYASVAMVDIAYLVEADQVGALMDLPLQERQGLLQAPLLPFDGMNEHGLAVGMAAVPPGDMEPDPSKETIGSLGIIRQILDHARSVDEAVAVFQSYNIAFGGPPLHYLVADRSGRSILVEFYQGEMIVIPHKEPWHAATNFLRASVGDPAEASCMRYNRIYRGLSEAGGRLSMGVAMDFLAEVAQSSTQWSVIYNMSTGDVEVVMGQQYKSPHAFHLPLGVESGVPALKPAPSPECPIPSFCAIIQP